MTELLPVRAFTDPILGVAGPPIVLPRPAEISLAEIIALVPLRSEAIRPLLRVKLNGELIDSDRFPYHRIRPKGDCLLTVVLPLEGGNNGILGTLAVVALAGASIFVGGAGLPFLGSAFAAGSIGANLVAGGLSLAASLLLQGLQPQGQGQQASGSREVGVASAQNTFEPGAPLQRVAGTRRVVPDLVMPPFSQLDGDDQIVTAVYGLDGPHQIEDIRNAGTAIEGAADIEYEVRQGLAGDAALTLVTDTRYEVPLNLRLSQFRMESTGEATNVVDTTISPYAPQWHKIETKLGVDRAKLFLVADQGLVYTGGFSEDPGPAITALRVRIRQKGTSDWYNLPEFLLRGEKRNGPMRVFLDFQWLAPADMPGSVAGFTANYGGFSWMYPTVQNNTASVTYWSADAYFATNKVDWANKQQVKVYLDTATFAQDAPYEIEVKRGYSASKGALTITSSTVHTISANSITLYDFFSTVSSGGQTKVPNGQTFFADTISVSAIQSIRDEYPFDLSRQPTTLIAIKARNRSLDRVDCLASGLVPDWDGAEWVADQPSRNPASWYRSVLTGPQNAEPTPEGLVDPLEDWHAWCAPEGLEVNAVFRGQPVDQVLSVIAQAGFARPRNGATYGVIIDRPRPSAQGKLINLRNIGGYSFEKPLGRLPHALRVNLADETRDYEVRELIAYADGYAAVADPVPLDLDFLTDTATVNGDESDIDGTGYFSRASVATRVNAAGEVETVASGAWRLDYDPLTGDPLGALFEAEATNLLLQSGAIGGASWSTAAATVTLGAGTAPDGTSGLTQVTGTGSASGRVQSATTTVAAGTDYRASIYVKAGSSPTSRLRIFNSALTVAIGNLGINWTAGVPTVALATGISAAEPEDVGDGVFRLSLVFNTGIYTGIRLLLYPHSVAPATGDVYAWGAELVEGTTVSSYIPTTAATVTRLADAMTVPLADFDYAGGAGTLTINGVEVSPVLADDALDVAATALAAGVSHVATLAWEKDVMRLEATRFESITYQGITGEAQAIRRALRDLRFARHRSMLHKFKQDIEHLEHQLGDLMRLEVDVLGKRGGRGRVRQVLTGGGNVTGLVLDEEWDFTHADANGLDRGVEIRLMDGSVGAFAVDFDNTDRHRVAFTTPFAMPTDGGGDLLVEGCLVTTGTLGQSSREVLLWDMAPAPGLTCDWVALDYAASEMYAALLLEDGGYLLLEDGGKLLLEEDWNQ